MTAIALSSCIGYSLQDQFAFQVNQRYLEEKLCAGLMEFSFDYANGPGTVTYEEFTDEEGNRFYTREDALANQERQYRARLAEKKRRLAQWQEQLGRRAREDPERAHREALDIITGKTPAGEDPVLNEIFARSRMPSFKQETRRQRSDIMAFELKAPQPRYIGQGKPEHCWAASLSTAFAYSGVEYEQHRFIEALKTHCPNGQRGAATVNQMLWSAYNVHAKGDRWLANYDTGTIFYVSKAGIQALLNKFGLPYIEYSTGSVNLVVPQGNVLQAAGLPVIPGFHNPAMEQLQRLQQLQTQTQQQLHFQQQLAQQQVQLPQIFSLQDTKLGWTTSFKDGRSDRPGGLYLLDKTSDIALALFRGYPVVFGFKDGKGGHTGVITRMTLRPGGFFDKKANTIYLDHRTFVNTVEYVDPKLGEGNIIMDGGTFLQQLAFAIAVRN